MAIDIKLPDLGDGIESGDVLEVLVKEGDTIAKEQGIIEIETDKATVEVPSPHAGKVIKIHVSQGQSVAVGTPLVSLESATQESGGTGTADSEGTQPEGTKKPRGGTATAETRSVAEPPANPPSPAEQPATPPAGSAESKQKPAPATPSATPPPAPAQGTRSPASVAESAAPDAAEGSSDLAAAGPAVRRFAREVGVDLGGVTGTGPGGRITRDDVLAVVRRANQASASATPPSPASARTKEPEARRGPEIADEHSSDAWGAVQRQPMPKIRQVIAAKMHQSWTTVPRVTNFDDADVTELERIRQASKADYAASGIKLTTLPFVIKAAALSLKSNPLLNASLDLENQQIIYKHYVSIGIAVDTERGLVVPALRNAERLSVPDISRALTDIAENVRNGDFKVDDLRGSTFTISNLGAVGGTYSTPIINVPEVAILLVGRSRKLPVVVEDKVAIRLMMPLSLSYDHRLVDGATAARFLNDVIGYLSAPSRLLMAP